MPYYQDFQKKSGRNAKLTWDEERPRGQKRGHHNSDEERETYSRNGQKDDRRFVDNSKPGSRGGRSFQKNDAPRRGQGFHQDRPAFQKDNKAPRSRKPADMPPPPRPRKPAETPHPGFDTPYAKEPENLLSGRNPIREALKADRDIEKMLVAKGDLSGSAREIVAMARERGIPVQVVERSRLDEITPHHQGILAYASAYKYAEVDDILAAAREKNEQPFIVVLDGITDPHNLGAIIRTAETSGADGVIIPKRRSASLNATVFKTSAGAASYVPVARVPNLAAALDKLKENGVWIYGTDASGSDYSQTDFTGGCGLVIGSEGFGISKLIQKKCDFMVKLPMLGKINSLNASVAAGIFMYEVLRQRRAAEK